MRDLFGDRIQPVVVYGAGGNGRETVQLIEDINAHRARWDVLGYIDDDPSTHGRDVNGLPVLGGLEWLKSEGANVRIALGVGSPTVKRRIVARVGSDSQRFITTVHPSVRLCRWLEIGPGTSIYLPPLQPHCLENTGAESLQVLGVFHPAGSPAAKQVS